MIPRYTDVEQFFSISPEDGLIRTTRPLDRENQAWHNISVSATEIGRPTPTDQTNRQHKTRDGTHSVDYQQTLRVKHQSTCQS